MLSNANENFYWISDSAQNYPWLQIDFYKIKTIRKLWLIAECCSLIIYDWIEISIGDTALSPNDFETTLSKNELCGHWEHLGGNGANFVYGYDCNLSGRYLNIQYYVPGNLTRYGLNEILFDDIYAEDVVLKHTEFHHSSDSRHIFNIVSGHRVSGYYHPRFFSDGYPFIIVELETERRITGVYFVEMKLLNYWDYLGVSVGYKTIHINDATVFSRASRLPIGSPYCFKTRNDLIQRKNVNLYYGKCVRPMEGRVISFVGQKRLRISRLIIEYDTKISKSNYEITCMGNCDFETPLTNLINGIVKNDSESVNVVPGQVIQIDLKKPQLISDIIVYGHDGMFEIQNLFIVYVDDLPFGQLQTPVGSSLTSRFYTFQAMPPIFGQNVTIRTMNESLNLTEIDFSITNSETYVHRSVIRYPFTYTLNGKWYHVMETGIDTVSYKFDLQSRYQKVKRVRITNYMDKMTGLTVKFGPEGKETLCGQVTKTNLNNIEEFWCPNNAQVGQFLHVYNIDPDISTKISVIEVEMTEQNFPTPLLRDCSELYEAGYTSTGAYPIDVNGQKSSKTMIDAFCSGGWTTILYRFPEIEESQLFFQKDSLLDYKVGFGTRDKHHWMGLYDIYR